jgi:hypothetical protein
MTVVSRKFAHNKFINVPDAQSYTDERIARQG